MIAEREKKDCANNRYKDDSIFFADSYINYSGTPDFMVRFIEENQILKRDSWKLFITPFLSGDDSHDNGWRGEYWGKMMRGASMVYQYTGNKELYELLAESVGDMLAAQSKDGRISSYTREKEFVGWDLWCRKYVLLGFLHFLTICESEELYEKTVTAMKGHADYIIERIGVGKKDIGETSELWDSVNSQSILEPMVRLYNLTGEARYLDFSEYIISKGGGNNCNLIELALENRLYPYQYPIIKAYEVISFFEGVIEYYRVVKDEKYKTAAINFADRLIESEITVIGCAGCKHEMFNNAAVTQTDSSYTGRMQETCVTVTWMKFCSQLLRLTGDAKYADRIERSAYNALYGAVNVDKSNNNGGLYFDSYSPLMSGCRGNGIGGLKVLDWTGICGCCSAIGAAGIALFPLCNIMRTKHGAVMNFYMDGDANVETPSGATVRIKTRTDYPVNGRISISLDMDTAERFEIKFRIPEFSGKTALKINSEECNAERGYFSADRVWKNGDVIEIELDMTARVMRQSDASDSKKKYICVQRGPIVLAADARLVKDIDRPIRVCESEGKTELSESCVAGFNRLVEYEAKLTDGEKIILIDYASAGRTWDENSKMAAWLPEKQDEKEL